MRLVDIKPYFNNPRDNSKAVGPTAKSIEKFGFTKPIIVDQNMVIIAGHTRYLAAFQLGMEEVPVIVSDMDEEKAKEYRIIDNKIAEKSSFDENQLVDELRNLKVPEDMQDFFFEDVHDMLNFDAPSFSASAGDYDDYGGGDDGGDEMSEENLSEDRIEHVDPENLQQSDEDGGENGESSDEGNGVSYSDLYRIQIVEGKKIMKVLCPYCGNIEEVEVK